MEYKLMIKEIRIMKGMTQEELARRANVHQTYISDLENNNNTKSPTLKTIMKIAEALAVCPHYLIQYDVDCKNNCLKNCNFFNPI
jgi:transcriptional regulator with XRE-family HTH domain